jgi:hypothetical protein
MYPDMQYTLQSSAYSLAGGDSCSVCALATSYYLVLLSLFSRPMSSCLFCSQASNLLSALRQVRETSALSLLDDVLVPPGVVLPETQGPKAWALARRLASLSRFLLEHMYR